MRKGYISKFLKDTKFIVSKHSPEILTGLGIAGMIISIGLAVKATPKALDSIEDKKVELEADELTVKETVQATWKHYIPTVVTAAASTACIIGANSVHSKRNAALATAYKLSETALSEYQNKVVEVVGEEKEREIREKMVKESTENHPVGKVYISSSEGVLYRDSYSGREFRANPNAIDRAVNKINMQMRNEMYASVNDWYSLLGLDYTTLGDVEGWNIDCGDIDLKGPYAYVNDHGEAYILLEFDRPPKENFNRLA